MKIVLGADHGGFELKEFLKKEILLSGKDEIVDIGCFNKESVDYPDYAWNASNLIVQGKADRAILICKSGIGMSIVANKVAGIRGALCMNEDMAEMSRRHNDANVLILAAHYIATDVASRIVHKWLITDFERGRHSRRVNRISDLENQGES